MSPYTTKQLSAAGHRTPWSIADSVQEIRSISNPSVWVLQVETPSHGGYWVPDHLLSRMSIEAQRYASNWSGSPQWYEEDCAWAYVALTFPELFPAEAQADAQRLMGFIAHPSFSGGAA